MDKGTRNHIENNLLDMSNDPHAPEDFRQAAFDEFLNFSSPNAIHNLVAFEQRIRSASLDLAGHSRDEVSRHLEAATRSIHQDVARQNQAPASVHGISNSSNAVSHPGAVHGHEPSTMSKPTAGGIAPPVGLQANQHPSIQPTHHANAAFLVPPAQRDPVNPRVSANTQAIIDRILADPKKSTREICEEIFQEGQYASKNSVQYAISNGRKELAFGASEQARGSVETKMRFHPDLNDPKLTSQIGRVLVESNTNSNPLIGEILITAANRYIAQGGQQNTLTLSHLAPHVDDQNRRIYEAFMNKPQSYVTQGPVSPGPISVQNSRQAMATQPQPQPQLQPPPPQSAQAPGHHFAQFPLVPMPSHADTVTGGATTSSFEPNKRQRVSGQFNPVTNMPPVATSSVPQSQLPVAPSTQQQPAPAVMPFGEKIFMPEQAAAGSAGQPPQAIGSGGAIAPHDIQPSQAPVLGNQAPLHLQPRFQPQTQTQTQQFPSQPRQTSSLEATTQRMQSVQPMPPMPSQPPLASQQPRQLSTAQPWTQPQQTPLQPLQTQLPQALPQQSQPMPQQSQLQPQVSLQPQLQPQIQSTPLLQAMTPPMPQTQPQQPQAQQSSL